MIPTRDGFGNELVALGKTNDKIVALSGDLEDATRAEYFKEAFPDRFFNLGIAEQDVIGTAVGLSFHGFIPFACSFAVFLTNRAYDMIRLDICYNNRNVKVVCSHAGVTVGQQDVEVSIVVVIAEGRRTAGLDAVEREGGIGETPGLDLAQ